MGYLLLTGNRSRWRREHLDVGKEAVQVLIDRLAIVGDVHLNLLLLAIVGIVRVVRCSVSRSSIHR